MAARVMEELDEAESLRLTAAGGVGRVAYQSRFCPAVLPVNYPQTRDHGRRLHGGVRDR